MGQQTSKKTLLKHIGAIAKCQIRKQLYIIKKLYFIFFIIWPTSHPITGRLGIMFAQPQLHSSVPHGSRSSIAELYS